MMVGTLEEIIDDNHIVPGLDEFNAHVATDVSSTACDQIGFHHLMLWATLSIW